MKKSNTQTHKSGMHGLQGKTAVLGVAGAVVGAGVAVVASKMLSDKKTRDKFVTAVSNVKEQVMEKMHTGELTLQGAKTHAIKQMENRTGDHKSMSKKNSVK